MTVTAACFYEMPTVLFQHFQDILNFHGEIIRSENCKYSSPKAKIDQGSARDRTRLCLRQLSKFYNITVGVAYENGGLVITKAHRPFGDGDIEGFQKPFGVHD